MNTIKKDCIYTFVANLNSVDTQFEGKEVVFSITGTKILEATQFAQRERLSRIYLTFKDSKWQIKTNKDASCLNIEITPEGLSKKTYEQYIISCSDCPA